MKANDLGPRIDVVEDSPAPVISSAGNDAWPRFLRVRPRSLILSVVALVGTAWLAFVAVDLFDFGGLGGRLSEPLWTHLFNDRPVEWIQWFILPAVTLAAAYVAGRLTGTAEARAGSFFLLLALGAGLMMIEDAGDVRHAISGYVGMFFGDTVLSLPHRVVSDVPFFAALAIVPLYALVRYGRDIRKVSGTRPFLIAGYGLYALAGGASGIRHLGDFYIQVGSRIDAWLLSGQMPVDPRIGQERTHFMVVDSLLEETIETFAAASLLALVLAFVAHLRGTPSDQLTPLSPSAGPAAVDAPAPPSESTGAGNRL